MLVRIEPKLDVCEGRSGAAQPGGRAAADRWPSPRRSRWRPARIGRSSELGVEEPCRQAPKLIAEGEKFAKKAFRRYKNNVVFPDDASANMDAFAAFLSRQAANMDAFRWPDMDMRLPPCHASLAAGGGWTRVQGAPGQRLGVIAFFRSEGNDQRER